MSNWITTKSGYKETIEFRCKQGYKVRFEAMGEGFDCHIIKNGTEFSFVAENLKHAKRVVCAYLNKVMS